MIGTIHSFCAQVLRERPVEARIDPAFEELPEREQQRMYDRAFDHWFERALGEERPGLRRALSRLAWMNGHAMSSRRRRSCAWTGKSWWSGATFARRGGVSRSTGGRDARTGERHHRPRSQELALGRPNDALYKALRPVRDMEEWIGRSRLPAHDPTTMRSKH